MLKIFTVFCLLLSSISIASDLEREKRLAEEIQAGLLDGEVVFLNSGDHRFLNILTTNTEDNAVNEAVIVLHGRGLHPDWADVTHPLRVGLVQEGFTTLSMQMPVLPVGAEYTDYAAIMHEAEPRITAGVKYLENLGYDQVHLVAHSCGTQMAMRWLSNGKGNEIASFTFIGLGTSNYLRYFGNLPPLDEIKQPVLDIFGQVDMVRFHSPKRLEMLKTAGNPSSRQVMIDGADHMFGNAGDELTRVISEWLSFR